MNIREHQTAISNTPLSQDQVRKMNAYWNAANYLSVGQIYLYANPLLKEPLTRKHIKPRLPGHWNLTSGLNFIYVHLNRIITHYDLSIIYIIGPSYSGPARVANTYLEGTYSETYPEISPDKAGMQRLFKQFPFSGGASGHFSPEAPGSIHEGGEPGHSLSHAFGAAFDNPDLIVACVISDGEAETGALANSWHSNKFLNPARDGAVLPILHLTGYKIASATVLARIPRDELIALFNGYGYAPYIVEGDDPQLIHQQMAAALDSAIAAIKRIQADARIHGIEARPRWPMIILRVPKGWTGPAEIDRKGVEGTFQLHRTAMDERDGNGGSGEIGKQRHLEILENWLSSYRPQELFDADGKLMVELAELAPKGDRRMGANPHANGGLLLRELRLPDFRAHAVAVARPGAINAEAMRVMGWFLRDVMAGNMVNKNFRLFSPDENNCNRWQDVLEVSPRAWMAERFDYDDKLATDGRVMEMLCEQQCQGWLEGYLRTGRHGFLSCCEAFIQVVGPMLNQHAKWLKSANRSAWRRPVASLNCLLSSDIWRQGHNGSSHQGPGFIDQAVNQKAEVVRVFLPPDANTLLAITDHCLRSHNLINIIVAGSQSDPQWLDLSAASAHCAAGIGIWDWASNDNDGAPDVVFACAGDTPTLEALAAVQLLWTHFPDVKIRLVNVVDLMKLYSPTCHPQGLTDADFDVFFTPDKPVIFAFQGYPALIHRLTYNRTNHRNFHVHGFNDENTATTPFDTLVINKLDRFHLFQAAITRLPRLADERARTEQFVADKLAAQQDYTEEYGEDLPEIRAWKWEGKT